MAPFDYPIRAAPAPGRRVSLLGPTVVLAVSTSGGEERCSRIDRRISRLRPPHTAAGDRIVLDENGVAYMTRTTGEKKSSSSRLEGPVRLFDVGIGYRSRQSHREITQRLLTYDRGGLLYCGVAEKIPSRASSRRSIPIRTSRQGA